MRKGGSSFTYGIQRRYLKDTIALLLLALLLSVAGAGIFVMSRVRGNLIQKYILLNEKMGIALDSLYQKSDEVTAECILNRDVQASLKTAGLTETQQNSLSKYFAYVDMDYVTEYIYVDNKGHVYTKSYSKVLYERFEKSLLKELPGEGYAKTTWIWGEDDLFLGEGPALFIGRYVRSMDYAHPPGMLYFKMGPGFLGQIAGERLPDFADITAGIISDKGELCALWAADNYQGNEDELRQISALAAGEAGGMILDNCQLGGGIASAYRQAETGFVVFIVIPNRLLWNELARVLLVLLAIYALVTAAAIILSIYFSQRFTRPIKQISAEMTAFNGADYSRKIKLQTNTELDQIGDSYNKMLSNIEALVAEIKEQEKELRTSQMNALISQINPHFLYNTLDTIYMLARIHKEEVTMKMIQALSKYLRISLSKGSDIISLKDELDNVRSYMEIQQIRNENLFAYTIDCRVDENQVRILKLILQPLVENAIKYGFCEMYDGGRIRITVSLANGRLKIAVFNNGRPIDREVAARLNRFNLAGAEEVKAQFAEPGSGFGVLNVMTRLQLKYGGQAMLHYEVLEGGTNCVILIPEEGGWNDETV